MINKKKVEKRIGLEESIDEALHIIKYNRDQVEDIKTQLFTKGIMKGQVQKIINKDRKLDQLNEKMLIMFAYALNECTGNNKINPINFYSKEEIDEILQEDVELNEISDKIKFPFTIGNSVKENDSYSSTVMLEFVEKLYNSSILMYNYMQGNYKFKKNIAGELNRSVLLSQNLIQEKVNEIMKTGKLEEPIFINVLNKNGEETEYSEEKMELTINQSHIIIMQGFHNINALLEVSKINPSLDVKIKLVVSHLDDRRMRHLINKLKIKGGAS